MLRGYVGEMADKGNRWIILKNAYGKCFAKLPFRKPVAGYNFGSISDHKPKSSVSIFGGYKHSFRPHNVKRNFKFQTGFVYFTL